MHQLNMNTVLYSLYMYMYCTVVEPLLQVHSGARVDRMIFLGSDISLYAGAQPITDHSLVQCTTHEMIH